MSDSPSIALFKQIRILARS